MKLPLFPLFQNHVRSKPKEIVLVLADFSQDRLSSLWIELKGEGCYGNADVSIFVLEERQHLTLSFSSPAFDFTIYL